MPIISAVGLFCCDKFEETPNKKVSDLSKLTKPYFNRRVSRDEKQTLGYTCMNPPIILNIKGLTWRMTIVIIVIKNEMENHCLLIRIHTKVDFHSEDKYKYRKLYGIHFLKVGHLWKLISPFFQDLYLFIISICTSWNYFSGSNSFYQIKY